MTIYEDEGRAPIVLDYAFHEINPLPVDVQEGITISGLAVDIELGAVEIKDALSETRATVLTAPATIAPQIGLATVSFPYFYDFNESAYYRVGGRTVTDARPPTAGLDVLSYTYGYNGATWDMIRGTAADGLQVDTELPAAAALSDTFVNPTAPAVGSFGMGWNKVLGQWVRLQTVDPGDPDHVSVATDDGWQIVYSANAGWDSGVLRGVAASLPDADGLGVVAEHGIHSLAHGYGFNGTTWDRLRVDATGNLLTTVSGLSIQVDSEFPAAIALSDTMANPTTTSVGSFNMGWSKTLAQWVRLQTMDAGGDTFSPISDDGVQVVFAAVAGLSGAIWRQAAVDQPNLDGLPATNFGLNVNSHALGFNGTTWDRLRSTTAAGLEVDVTNASIATTVSGLLAVNVAGNDSDAVTPLADNILDANSYLMAYDEQNNQWERARVSYAATTDNQVAADMDPVLGVGSYPMIFDGTAWDRQRGTGGAANVIVTNANTPSDSSSTNAGLNTVAAAMLWSGTNYHRWRADQTGVGRVSLYGQDVAAGDTALSVTPEGYLETIVASGLPISVNAVLNSGDTIGRAVIAESSSGNNEIVAAVGGEQIKVLSVLLVASGTVNVEFQSSTTPITGTLVLDAGGAGFALAPPANKDMHHFETAVGEALNLDLSDSVYVGGFVVYYSE